MAAITVTAGGAVQLRVGLIGDHDLSVVAHRAIPKALQLAADAADLGLRTEWIGTDGVDARRPDFAHFDGLWCVPGSPYRNAAGALAGVRWARELQLPFLGTCAGFQHALLECAESLWGIAGAAHAESDADAADPVIAPLACGLVEESGVVHFAPGSELEAAYGRPSAEEEYHCGYGLNPRYRSLLDDGPLRATAWDDSGDVRGVELEGHPFFVATLFQPERAALGGRVPPVVASFLAAVARRAGSGRARTPGAAKGS